MSDKSSESRIIWQRAEGILEEEYRARLGRVYSLLLRLAAQKRLNEPNGNNDQENSGGQRKGEIP